jgi:hypothetical protein
VGEQGAHAVGEDHARPVEGGPEVGGEAVHRVLEVLGSEGGLALVTAWELEEQRLVTGPQALDEG